MEKELTLKKKWRSTDIIINSDEIITVSPTRDVRHEIEDIISFRRFITDLTKGESAYLLTDLRFHDFKLSREAIKYTATDDSMTKYIAAQAYIISSLPNRLIIRFFLNVGKPKFPVKIFKSKKTALAWITELKAKKESQTLPH